jgi:hypothetical protein
MRDDRPERWIYALCAQRRRSPLVELMVSQQNRPVPPPFPHVTNTINP